MNSVVNESKYGELLTQHKKREKNRPKSIDKNTKNKRTKQWCTFYRRNINLYASERLKIKLKPFQHIMLYLMGKSDVFFAICSRGLSKSFIVALYCLCKALLYPYSEIVVVSSTIDQANKIIDNKIDKELIGKLSPVLQWMKKNELIKVSHPKDCACVEFWNKSWIKVMPALDSSRGERASVLVAEECRLIKKTTWDSVFKKMAHPRQAEFLSSSVYEGEKTLLEDCQEIYITSAYFKSEWFWRAFKNCVKGCYNDVSLKYNFYAGDIFTAIKHGLKTNKDLKKAKQDSGELEYRMEDLNEMVGEGENAYFPLEMFRKNQVLTKAFRPYTSHEFNSGINLKNRPKKENEFRLLCVDLAFTDNAKGKKDESDRCALECMSIICKDNGDVTRHLDYIDSLSGGDDKLVKRTMRELFWDYQCDYIVMDLRNGGENYYNDLSTPWKHPEREDWNSHGFGLCSEDELQVISSGKITELANRTVDVEYIPCIIPIQGSSEFNSIAWKSLWKSLNNGSLRLLEDELQFEKRLDDKKYMLMTSEEKVRCKNPFVQTNLLITEGIALTPTWRNGILSLHEPRSGHKDRMSALQYGNLIADKIENKYVITLNQDNFSIDEYRNCLMF